MKNEKTDLVRRMEFADLKQIVKEKDKHVTEWLDAMRRIRDEELYLLDGHASFHSWAQANCPQSYSQVRRLMAERDTQKMIAETTGEPIVKSKSTKTTSPESASGAMPPSVIDVPTTNKKTSTKDVAVVRDAEGNELKFEALKNWGRREEVKQVLSDYKLFRDKLETVLDPRDVIWHEINFTMLEARMDELGQILRAAIPHAVCTECMGAPSTRGHKCGLCGNKGLISKTLWDAAVPEEKKKMMAKIAKGQK